MKSFALCPVPASKENAVPHFKIYDLEALPAEISTSSGVQVSLIINAGLSGVSQIKFSKTLSRLSCSFR